MTGDLGSLAPFPMGPVTEERAERVVSVRGAAYETRLRPCPLDKSIPKL